MFLLIGESIGMQELILIGVIALIVFGPRKLPEMARTIGKYMAEFRKATSEFKETWEKEVNFDEFKEDGQMKPISTNENTIAKNVEINPRQINAPEIKELGKEEFEKNFPTSTPEKEAKRQPQDILSDKQNWL